MHVLGLTENNRLWDNIVLLYFDTGKQYLKYHIFYAISTSAPGLVGRNSSAFVWRPPWTIHPTAKTNRQTVSSSFLYPGVAKK